MDSVVMIVVGVVVPILEIGDTVARDRQARDRRACPASPNLKTVIAVISRVVQVLLVHVGNARRVVSGDAELRVVNGRALHQNFIAVGADSASILAAFVGAVRDRLGASVHIDVRDRKVFNGDTAAAVGHYPIAPIGLVREAGAVGGGLQG